MQMLGSSPTAPAPQAAIPSTAPRRDFVRRRWTDTVRPWPAAVPAGGSGPDLLAAHLVVVRQAIAIVCRQNRLSSDEADELGSTVFVKLLDNEGAILRKFRGESQFGTFLVVVIKRILLDMRVARWGKWRPSARARRLGAVATALEHYVYGQGLQVHEAAHLIRCKFGASGSDVDLHGLLSQLPARFRRRFVNDAELEEVASNDAPRDECGQSARRAGATLARALETLCPEDRLLVDLRFDKGVRMCEIARRHGIDAAALYRRFDRVMKQLRVDLERRGFTSRDLQAWISSPHRHRA